MLSRRYAIITLANACIFSVSKALAGEYIPYDAVTLAAAKKAGRKIVVFFFAPWCSYCNAQKPILTSLINQPKYKDFLIFEVDFDSMKTLRSELGITNASTFIVYRGMRELSRTTYITDYQRIAASLDRA